MLSPILITFTDLWTGRHGVEVVLLRRWYVAFGFGDGFMRGRCPS